MPFAAIKIIQVFLKKKGHSYGVAFVVIRRPNYKTRLQKGRVLHAGIEFFKRFGSRAISEFAHEEAAWKETNEEQVISYQYADSLQLQS